MENGSASDARDALLALRSDPQYRDSAILYLSLGQQTQHSPLDLGADDCVSAQTNAAELVVRVKRLATRKRQRDTRQKTINALGERAYKDAVTQINNRWFADTFLARYDRDNTRNPRPMALLLLDVDHFKSFNDTHGHSAGDALLRHVAGILSKNVRHSDLLARFGGDEFIVALPNVARSNARRIGDRLRTAVADTPLGLEDGPHLRPTASIGLAYSSVSENKSSFDLKRDADAALYAAKQSGRNRLRLSARLSNPR